MLKTEEIQAIAVIAAHGSMTKAAQLLSTTQPTLSKLILRLEDRVGAPMFERTAKGMVPTKVGQFLIDQSKELMANLEKIERHAMLLGDGTIGRINLGVGPIVEELFLKDAIVAFARRYGGIDLDIRAAESDRLLELVTAGELDMAIGPFDDSASSLGLSVHPVAEDPIIFAVRPEHPLAAEAGPVSAEHLGGFATVSPHTPMSITSQILGRGKAMGITSNQRISCESYATLKHIATQSDYVIAGPRGLFITELEAGTLLEIQTDWKVIWRCACIIRPEYEDADAIRHMAKLFRQGGERLRQAPDK